MRLRDRLSAILNEEEMKQLVAGFDIVGDIAIIEIPAALESKKEEIAKALMQQHRHVKTVLRKAEGRKGELRLPELETILGGPVETIHTENGYRLKLNVKEAYFSPREGTERQRIAGLVRPGETVLVMFAGIGPYPIAICKKQRAVKEVVAIEKNGAAVMYMRENIRLNRLSHLISPVQGDASERHEGWSGRFDRVVMPLPLSAHEYLPLAFEYARPGGVIHFYSTGPEESPFENAESAAMKACERGVKFRVIREVIVLPYAPRIVKICIDMEALK